MLSCLACASLPARQGEPFAGCSIVQDSSSTTGTCCPDLCKRDVAVTPVLPLPCCFSRCDALTCSRLGAASGRWRWTRMPKVRRSGAALVLAGGARLAAPRPLLVLRPASSAAPCVPASDTASASRDHVVTEDLDGLITVTGGPRLGLAVSHHCKLCTCHQGGINPVCAQKRGQQTLVKRCWQY